MTDLIIPVAIFESKDDNKPVRHDVSWQSLAERLCRYEERFDKDGRAWSPVTYRPGTTRARDNVEQVHALVLDIDHHDLPTDLLNGLEYVAHTTFSHTPDDPRWRAILPLTRAVLGEEWPEFWLRANAYFGGCVDPQTKDRSRIFYLPSCQPGAQHQAQWQHGLLLDPASLPSVPQYEPNISPPRFNGQLHAVPSDTLQRWAQDFCTAKLNDLAVMTPESGRNAACNRIAYTLAGLAAHPQHGIDTHWLAEQLFVACERNHLVFEDGERSVRNTIASGLISGAARAWSPADQDDDWTPSPQLQVSSSAAVVTGPWPEPEDRGLAVLSPQGTIAYVDDLIRPGRILVWAAEEGSGKSFTVDGELAIRMVKAGGKLAGVWDITQQGPVLVLSEMHSDDDFDRENIVLKSLNLTRADLLGHYWRLSLLTAGKGKPVLDLPSWRDWVTQWCKQRGVLLLVFDTGTGATSVDPWGNSFHEVYSSLRLMLEQYPALSIIVVVHLKKTQKSGRGIQDVMGEWGRWCDVVVMQELDGPDKVRLTSRKRVKKQRRIIATQRDGLLADPVDLNAKGQTKVSQDKFLDAIKNSPHATLAELAPVLNVSVNTVKKYAEKAEQEGIIEIIGKGTRGGGISGGLRVRLRQTFSNDQEDVPMGVTVVSEHRQSPSVTVNQVTDGDPDGQEDNPPSVSQQPPLRGRMKLTTDGGVGDRPDSLIPLCSECGLVLGALEADQGLHSRCIPQGAA